MSPSLEEEQMQRHEHLDMELGRGEKHPGEV